MRSLLFPDFKWYPISSIMRIALVLLVTLSVPHATTSAAEFGVDWVQESGKPGWDSRSYFPTVEYNGEMWLLGGSSNGGVRKDVWRSADGAEWEQDTATVGWSARASHTAVVLDNKIWVMGGNDGAKKNDVWKFDGTTWTQDANTVGWSIRENHASVVFDGKIWVMGGRYGSFSYNDVWYFDPASPGWHQATASAGWSARYCHTATVFDGKIWVIGGNYNHDVWYSSDGANWTRATNTVPWGSRSGMKVVTFHNSMVITGGDLWQGGKKQDAWCSSDGVNWTALPTPKWTGRTQHSSLVFDNRHWVLGGEPSSGGRKNDVWCAEDCANWSEATRATPWTERSDHTAVSFKGRLWMIGGYGTGEVWHSEDGSRWEKNPQAAPFGVRIGHTTVVLNDKIWVLGGLTTGSRKNDVWSSADGVLWTQVTASAGWSARYQHVSIAHDGKLWVLGGHDGTYKNDVWSSADGLAWTQVDASADWSVRYGHTGLSFDGKMWVMSGEGSGATRRDVWSSADDGVSWTQHTTPAWQGRYGLSSFSHGGKLWICSGSNNLNDLWCSADGNTWSQPSGTIPWGVRTDHVTVVHNNKMYLIGGAKPYYNYKDVWSTMDDADGDGIPDQTEGSELGSPPDTDGDSTPDFEDTDSDNDGVADADEGLGDADADTIPNRLDLDSDWDGYADQGESTADTDGDGTPDFLDFDSDDDGLWDRDEYESGGDRTIVDTDGDGYDDLAEWEAGSDVTNNLDTPVFAADFIVDDDGAEYPSPDFSSIQDAVDVACDGDVILVYPGRYGRVVVNDPFETDPGAVKSLRIISTYSAAPPTLDELNAAAGGAIFNPSATSESDPAWPIANTIIDAQMDEDNASDPCTATLNCRAVQYNGLETYKSVISGFTIVGGDLHGDDGAGIGAGPDGWLNAGVGHQFYTGRTRISYNIIRDNKVTGAHGGGIDGSAGYVENNVICYNSADNGSAISQSGFYLFDPEDTGIEGKYNAYRGPVIRKNVMRNGSAYLRESETPFAKGASVLYFVHAASISDNYIYDNNCIENPTSQAFTFAMVSVNLSVIERNTIFNNKGGGIDKSQGCTVRNNIFYHNCQNAINEPTAWLGSPVMDASILNNVIWNNGMHPDLPGYLGGDQQGVGIRLRFESSSRFDVVRVQNNIIWGNKANATSGFDAMDVQFFADANTLDPAGNDYIRYLLENNVIQNRSANPNSTSLPARLRNLSELGRTEQNNLNTDPLVTLAPTFSNIPDFSLTGSSPAIDAGKILQDVSDDFNKEARPQDADGDGLAVHDIGAYEVEASIGGGGGGCCE